MLFWYTATHISTIISRRREWNGTITCSCNMLYAQEHQHKKIRIKNEKKRLRMYAKRPPGIPQWHTGVLEQNILLVFAFFTKKQNRVTAELSETLFVSMSCPLRSHTRHDISGFSPKHCDNHIACATYSKKTQHKRETLFGIRNRSENTLQFVVGIIRRYG